MLFSLQAKTGHGAQALTLKVSAETPHLGIVGDPVSFSGCLSSKGTAIIQGDRLHLAYPNASFGSAIAFYALVHFDYDQIRVTLREFHRVLRPGGEVLLSFHVGDETVHLDEFLGQPVNVDFRVLLLDDNVLALLVEAGFTVIEALERHPYPEEHPTARAYQWVKKPTVTTE